MTLIEMGDENGAKAFESAVRVRLHLPAALADLERAKAAFRDATQAGRDLPPEAEFGRLQDDFLTAQIAFNAALDQVTGGLAKRIAEVLA